MRIKCKGQCSSIGYIREAGYLLTAYLTHCEQGMAWVDSGSCSSLDYELAPCYSYKYFLFLFLFPPIVYLHDHHWLTFSKAAIPHPSRFSMLFISQHLPFLKIVDKKKKEELRYSQVGKGKYPP